MDSYYTQIVEMIDNATPEAVFVVSDFVHIAPVNTVRQCLSRLEQAGQIVRIIRGVYYQPAYSELLDEYESPSPHHVAMALARKFGWTISPSGETALNQLGLSTQVPAKWLYVSDGPYNSFSFGNITIEFKHRSNREISGMSYKTALVIQALRALGKDRLDDATTQKLRRSLTDQEKAALLTEAKYTVSWIYEAIKAIAN